MFFTFLMRKNSLRKTFLLECVRSGAQQAARKGGNFGAKLTHLCGLWLDVSFFSHVKKNRSWFWLDVSFFSHVKTIVHSSDWLELICISKITTQLFGEYFTVCIIIIKRFLQLMCREPFFSLWCLSSKCSTCKSIFMLNFFQTHVSSEEWCYTNDTSYGIIVFLFWNKL